MIVRLSKFLALLCSSGFSVGLILTSVVIVESWASLEPSVAIEWFEEFGLPLGLVMVPFGGLAAVFSAVAFLAPLLGHQNRDGLVLVHRACFDCCHDAFASPLFLGGKHFVFRWCDLA